MNYKGPCLKHCYYRNALIVFFFGIYIGLKISKFSWYIRRNKKSYQ